MASISVLGISGSLRKGSYNTSVLRTCLELAPSDMRIEIFDLAPIPLYNGDLDGEGKTPAVVNTLKDKIRAADAVLIVSPEYNYSVPGVLKNAIDWASRSPQGTLQCFLDKPVAIAGASPGALGTGRMQYHLRQSFVFLDAHVMNKPEVMIAKANEKIDANGRLTDEATRKHLETFLAALGTWARRLNGSRR